jgi:serine protease inhibitor
MRKMTLGIIAGLLALGVACNSRAAIFSRAAGSITVELPESISYNDYDGRREIKENNPVGDDFYEAFNNFSYNSAAKILENPARNTAFSPAGLFYSLSLAAQGASGQTQSELLTTLGVADAKKLAAECSNLYRLIYADNETGKLRLANSLWLSERTAFKKPFLESAAGNFYAETFKVNFADPETGRKMGDWVAQNTGGRLTPDISTDPDQLVSIINTVWLKDEWLTRFDERNTTGAEFFTQDGQAVTCDFMMGSLPAEFSKGENFSRAALPLKNCGEMIFILPDEGVLPAELLKSGDSLREALEGGFKKKGEVVFKIPRFDFKSELELIDVVRGLGVSLAFEKNADFSNLTESSAYISNITQQVSVAIDENGVQAAAFTEIAVDTAMMSQERNELVLNRPFLFAIRTAEGAPLFIGVCLNPAAGS